VEFALQSISTSPPYPEGGRENRTQNANTPRREKRKAMTFFGFFSMGGFSSSKMGGRGGFCCRFGV
jgi:hypothetical protein